MHEPSNQSLKTVSKDTKSMNIKMEAAGYDLLIEVKALARYNAWWFPGTDHGYHDITISALREYSLILNSRAISFFLTSLAYLICCAICYIHSRCTSSDGANVIAYKFSNSPVWSMPVLLSTGSRPSLSETFIFPFSKLRSLALVFSALPYSCEPSHQCVTSF